MLLLKPVQSIKALLLLKAAKSKAAALTLTVRRDEGSQISTMDSDSATQANVQPASHWIMYQDLSSIVVLSINCWGEKSMASHIRLAITEKNLIRSDNQLVGESHL